MTENIKIAEVVVSFITPLLVVLLGWRVRQLERRLKLSEYAEQKVMDWRLSVYQDVAPILNDIYCFVTYRGAWKHLKPTQIIESKRTVDKKVSIYAPYLSADWNAAYEGFMDACFATYAGKGKDAQLRCGFESHKEFGDYPWEERWNDMFVSDQSGKTDKDELSRRYNSLLDRFAGELGLKSVKSAC